MHPALDSGFVSAVDANNGAYSARFLVDDVRDPPRRVGPAEVAAALAEAEGCNPYLTPGDPGEVLLRALRHDRDALAGAVERVAARLGVGEARVAASALHFGVAVRLWSFALGPLAARGVVPDLDRLRFRLIDAATVRLSMPEPGGGWTGAGDPAPLVVRAVVDRHLRPLHRALRATTRVAEGLLWGNAASALGAAARLAPRALGDLPRRLLVVPDLAGALAPDGTRRSCCLYYRTPGGPLCHDCPLEGAAVTTRPPRRRRDR